MSEWRSGGVEEWRSGGVEEWRASGGGGEGEGWNIQAFSVQGRHKEPQTLPPPLLPLLKLLLPPREVCSRAKSTGPGTRPSVPCEGEGEGEERETRGG